jgi:hypothetical protein
VSDGVYVSLNATLDEAAYHGWRRALLEPMRDALRGVGEFDAMHAGDDDHVADFGEGATVADLLAYLARAADGGELFFELVREATVASVRAFLPTWSDLHRYEFQLIYSAARARDVGGAAALSLLGELGGEIVIVLVDASPSVVSVRRPDPQDFGEDHWNERLGGIASFDAARARWAKTARRRRRR